MSDTVVFLDWISYTRMNDVKKLEYPSEFAGCAREVVWEWQRYTAWSEKGVYPVLHVKPNKPFADARMETLSKSRIEWGGGSDRVLCSFSGEGCQRLRAMGRTQALLAAVCADVTRIDLSVDIRTETTPFEFAGKRDKEKHKNGALMFSEEGSTQYVGSWSSDRFARVYRYNAPHERSDFLRVEHVFKGKQAKILASKLVSNSPSSLLAAAGEIYGWSHQDFKLALERADQPEDVTWYKQEKKQGKTVKWLQETACPAILRMVREGEIENLKEWLQHNLYDMLDDNGNDTKSQ